MNIILTCIVGQLGLSGLGISINCFSLYLIVLVIALFTIPTFISTLLLYSHLQIERYWKSAIKSLWTRYSDFRALLLVTIWCTCQSLNKFLAPLPGILFSHLILYQYVSPIFLFLAYFISIFSLLLFYSFFLSSIIARVVPSCFYAT